MSVLSILFAQFVLFVSFDLLLPNYGNETKTTAVDRLLLRSSFTWMLCNPQILCTFAITMTRIQSLIHSAGVRNFAKLLSANVIAQLIGLLVYPVLTRLYSPDDFGLLSLFLSIGGILVLLSTAEYQYAIVLPKEQSDAVACFHAGGLWLLVVSVLCGVSSLFRTQIAALFNAPDLATYYPFLCVFVFATGLWNLLNYWYIRNSRFGRVSAFQLTMSVTNSGLKWGLGAAGWLRGGLIFSTSFGTLLSVMVSICYRFKSDIKPLLSFDRMRIRSMTKRYRNFPLFALPKSLVNTFSSNLPVLLLTPVFGLKEMGFFGMAITLSFTPISLISRSLYQVLYQKTTTQVQRCERIKPFFMRFLCLTLLVVLPSFAVLYCILPWLTQWLLGVEWYITGEYIRLLFPWLIVSTLIVPLGPLTDIFMKQKWWLYFEVIMFLLRLAAIGIGIHFANIRVAILGYSVAGAIGLAIQYPWYMKLISNYENHINPANHE